jgi:hypothetical protein
MAGKGAAPVPAVEGGFRLADGLSLIGFPAFEKNLVLRRCKNLCIHKTGLENKLSKARCQTAVLISCLKPADLRV